MPERDAFFALDATAQADLVRRGEVTAGELVEAAIARIEGANDTLNAIIHPLFQKARDAAAAESLVEGPFRGVPFVVKDAVCHTAGDPYHLGSRALKRAGWIARTDSELARRFRRSGFVIVGKSNTPEFATSTTTEPLAYGPTRNPWRLDHSTGGSSGGSAAAVAAGLVPVAHANDMGGSIRIPASACGLVGLKPTRARNSLAPSFGEYWGPLTHEHVVTRSLRDCAGVLDATAGPAPGDPYSAPAPNRPFCAELGVDPGRLRIGIRTHYGPGKASGADCCEGVRATAKLLESLGHAVEEVDLPALDDPRLSTGIGVVMMATVAREVERWSRTLGRSLGADEVEPANFFMAEAGRGITASQYIAAVEDLQGYSRGVAQWWHEGWDLLVTPTCPDPAPPLGELAPEVPVQELMRKMGRYSAFTAPFNATGQPAISLPLHISESGVPVGVQLVADYGREDLLLRVGSQLELARGGFDCIAPAFR